MFHIPAHKNVRFPAGQVGLTHTPIERADWFAMRKSARFAAEEQAFRMRHTPVTQEEDDAFESMGGTEYQRGGFDAVQAAAERTCERLSDAPYNHRDCDVLCAFGPEGVESQWPLFAVSVGYDIGAVMYIPAGSTRRSMFADTGDRIVNDRIVDREWDWYA